MGILHIMSPIPILPREARTCFYNLPDTRVLNDLWSAQVTSMLGLDSTTALRKICQNLHLLSYLKSYYIVLFMLL